MDKQQVELEIHPLRVLMVDDQPRYIGLIPDDLEDISKKGIEVIRPIIGSYRSAVEFVMSGQKIIDLMVVDYELGNGQTGVDLMYDLYERNHKINFIVLSATDPSIVRSNICNVSCGLPRLYLGFVSKGEGDIVDSLYRLISPNFELLQSFVQSPKS